MKSSAPRPASSSRERTGQPRAGVPGKVVHRRHTAGIRALANGAAGARHPCRAPLVMRARVTDVVSSLKRGPAGGP
jgi:hypothetical protein